jgi:quercetin dioxygenase-like cupin family protein
MSTILFYKKECQSLKTDAKTQSTYWSIRSEKMSFTYFEVPPNTEFEKHKHINEQITYVMKGELYFEADGITYCLEPGDSIVIASNIEHRAWTTNTGAIAVDSWTPAFDQY